MSHFTVGVITKEKQTNEYIGKILEPYYEYTEVEPYIYQTKDELVQEAKGAYAMRPSRRRGRGRGRSMIHL